MLGEVPLARGPRSGGGDATCPRTVASLLATELEGLDDRIACLTRSRDTIREFLARTNDRIDATA